MYNKVAIPLDGSKLAETALPHLEFIARGCSIPEILLVSVTEEVKGSALRTQVYESTSPGAYPHSSPVLGSVQTNILVSTHTSGMQNIPVTLGKMSRSAFDYLCRIAEDLEKKGFDVEINVLVGNPADEIVKFVDEKGADLIVMASRGKSGFSRWDVGNIAEKVIRASKVPVMVVKPGADFKETKPKRKGKSS